MKKLLAVVLALMLVLTLALPLAQADALEEITILYPGEETDEMSNFLKGAFAEKVAAELNMKVNFRFLSWDAYWDQKSVMLGANEAIDLYWDGLPDLSTMVNKKEAQPLDELLAKCWPESMKEIIPDSQMAGGKINGVQYGIPSAYAPSSAMFQFVCLRQDVLEQVGMNEVKTAEDLREYALRVQEQLPQFKGPADIIFKPLTRNFAEEQYTWVASQDLVVFGEESKKAYSYAHTDAFKQVAQFNREMFLDGLYQDDVAIKYNERDSRMQTGLYLWVEGSLGKENEIIGSVKTADGERDHRQREDRGRECRAEELPPGAGEAPLHQRHWRRSAVHPVFRHEPRRRPEVPGLAVGESGQLPLLPLWREGQGLGPGRKRPADDPERDRPRRRLLL